MTIDLGAARSIEAESFGQPGQRTFRLRVMSGHEAASLWLEKEHLIRLTLAIRQLLEQTAERDETEEAPPPAAGAFRDAGASHAVVELYNADYARARAMMETLAHDVRPKI